jgi:hypothetical protein
VRRDNDEDEDYWDPAPDDPDWDLTEAHGYSEWEPRQPLVRPWMIALTAALFVLALLFPVIRLIS